MNLLDILAQYKIVRDDLAGGSYLQAWQDTLPLQQGMIDLGKSLGFKAGPNDGATCAEIVACGQDCVSFCDSGPVMSAATGAFDWKSLLKAFLQALLDAWKQNNPTP